jgi:UDP-N-acetylglucosamine 4-epimerase
MYTQPYHTADLSKHSFLITGGAGFIGSNIIEYLLKHGARKVRALDNFSTGHRRNIEQFLPLPNFELIEGDITVLKDCTRASEGIDYVTHQAAMGSVPRSIKDPLSTHHSNATGFLNMLIAARDAGVKRFVYASSSSVYGDSPVLPKKESTIGHPLSPYAVTKQTNELYADVFVKNYNMEVIGLRYFNIFGPKQDPEGPYAAAIPLFINALLKNEAPVIFDDGEQSRDFTFVANAVQANIRAFFASEPLALNQVYNIAMGKSITVNELFKFIREFTGATVSPVYKEKRRGDIRDSLADVSKANKLLGYSPSTDTREGLKQTIAWFKEHIYVNK